MTNTITRAYGKAIVKRARTHAPEKTHALLIQGNWVSALCNSGLDGLPDYSLTKDHVNCPNCIKTMAKAGKPWEREYSEGSESR